MSKPTETVAAWRPAVVAVAVRKADGTRAKHDRRVEAAVLDGGLFAVHPTIEMGRGNPVHPTDWTVTHVPTGYAMILHASDEAAARCAAVLLAGVPVDWPALTPATSSAVFRSLPVRTRERLRSINRRACRTPRPPGRSHGARGGAGAGDGGAT